MKSELGLYRITLFSGGDIIGIWKPCEYHISATGIVSFEDDKGNPTMINGTYTIVKEG